MSATDITGRFTCAVCKGTVSRSTGYQLKAGQPADQCERCFDESRGLVLWHEDGYADHEDVFQALLAWHAERGLQGPAEDQFAGMRVLARHGEALMADPFRQDPAETVRVTLPNGSTYEVEADWSGSDCDGAHLAFIVLRGEVVR